jgi:hypothetical protein
VVWVGGSCGPATKATSAATRLTSAQWLSVGSAVCRTPIEGGIEIHTDRARLEVLHPRCASTLHFSRQHPSKHFDGAFDDRKIRGLAPSRVRQRNSRQRCVHPRSYARTPACVATNAPARVDVDHAASSWMPVSSISGIAAPTLLMNTSTDPKRLSCRWRPRHGRPSRPSVEQSPCRRVLDCPNDRHRRESAPFV